MTTWTGDVVFAALYIRRSLVLENVDIEALCGDCDSHFGFGPSGFLYGVVFMSLYLQHCLTCGGINCTHWCQF